MTSLVLLISILTCVAAAPFPDVLDNRLSKPSQDGLSVSPETASSAVDYERKAKPSRKHADKDDEGSMKDSEDKVADEDVDDENQTRNHRESKARGSKRSRKHKAFFVDYPFVQQLQQFSSVPSYASNNYEAEVEGRNKYKDSNIFYIRLPPTPYSYIPGIGYISQPPTYSTAGLRPQIAHSMPVRRPAVYQKPVNPFINLPIDFVSNGKPTSVYQWQGGKPSEKPDSPITNLDNVSAGFVSNGKPTSIYQWHANRKAAKRPSSVVNTLDNGPYVFNGRPAALYLLSPDGTTSAHQPIRYNDYQQETTFY